MNAMSLYSQGPVFRQVFSAKNFNQHVGISPQLTLSGSVLFSPPGLFIFKMYMPAGSVRCFG